MLYFGKRYTLKLVVSDREDIYLDEVQNTLVVYLAKLQEKLLLQEEKLSVYVKSVFYRFLQKQANEYLPKLISELNLLTKLQHKHLVIKRYKARWGSCNNNGEISLNYLLMTCPDWVIRYVVIHELCHLKHLNHSAQFWALVVYFCPTYKEAKSWLNTQSFNIRS